MRPEVGTEVVEQEIRVDASPETVFAFFTDPSRIIAWKGIRATLDPRPGGVYRVDINERDVVRGEFVEVSPFSRIVFTWGWERGGDPVPPGATVVEVSLERDGDGTIVRLKHRGLREDARPAHTRGWEHYLGRLAKAAAGRDPGPDPWAETTGS